MDILIARGSPCTTCGRGDGTAVRNGSRVDGSQVWRPQCQECNNDRQRRYHLPKIKTKPIVNRRGHAVDGSKHCTKCMRVFPLDDFYTGGIRDGVQRRSAWCKDCLKPKFAADYRKDPSAKWRYTIERQYNFTAEQYEELAAAQNWRCAVCGIPAAEQTRRMSIDHDHSCCPGEWGICGKCVRGLLCSNCNRGLGIFEEDPDTLLAAAIYLLQFTDMLGGNSEF